MRSRGGIDGVTLAMGRWHTEGQTPKHLAWNREAQGLIPVTLPTSRGHWGKSCPLSELPFPQLQNIGGVDMLSKVPEISGARQDSMQSQRALLEDPSPAEFLPHQL